MSKLAIIDLDGVVCDSSARFAKAEEAKAAYKLYLAKMENDASQIEKEATDLYWRTAFAPSLVELDTLIDGAVEALDCLERDDYCIYFLTSRPETMRNATFEWLSYRAFSLSVLRNERLILKPLSQQFVKTPTWKAGTIEVLARVFGADELLVVDDEHAQQLAADLAGLDCFKLTCVASLAEAVATIG